MAEVEGDVVGFAHLLTYHDLPHGALAAELLGLLVRQDMRRQGIGAALLREVCALAADRGVGELHINTEPDNETAQILYRNMGAKQVGVQFEVELDRGPNR